jgi:DNA-binding transcriptional regulator YhcF (GntR family)
VADINREKLRSEKLSEARDEIRKILNTGKRFGIEPSELVDIIHSLGDEE